jgi:hypothetical protein
MTGIFFSILFNKNTSGGEKTRRECDRTLYRCNESFGRTGMSSHGRRLDPHFEAVALWFFLTLLRIYGFQQMTFEKFAD